jgi:starvation-inducible outer membrane lipoprotein
MKYLIITFLLAGCMAQPKPTTDSEAQRLIKTICKQCHCQSVDVDGESISATCYEPQAKENRNGNKTSI